MTVQSTYKNNHREEINHIEWPIRYVNLNSQTIILTPPLKCNSNTLTIVSYYIWVVKVLDSSIHSLSNSVTNV